jgi:hypothetical protein
MSQDKEAALLNNFPISVVIFIVLSLRRVKLLPAYFYHCHSQINMLQFNHLCSVLLLCPSKRPCLRHWRHNLVLHLQLRSLGLVLCQSVLLFLGFNNNEYLELPQSGSDQGETLAMNSNVNKPGQWRTTASTAPRLLIPPHMSLIPLLLQSPSCGSSDNSTSCRSALPPPP